MEQKQIEQIVENYISEFNQSNVDGLVSLFTEDAVVMAPNAPTINGSEQLRAFFKYGLSLVKMEAKIYFDETKINGNSAYVRTHSEVKVTDLKSNVTLPEEDRELFIFRKDNGQWKIAVYMFNKKS